MKSIRSFTQPPVLETERLLLRPFKPEDAASIYQYASDSQIGWNCGWPAHQSEEESRRIIETVLMVPGTWAIATIDQPERAIGSISLMEAEGSNLKLEDNELEIGFWIGRPFWNQGYMSEAAECLRDFAFDGLEADRLKAAYAEFNPASGAVQRHIGMRKQKAFESWHPLIQSRRRSILMAMDRQDRR